MPHSRWVLFTAAMLVGAIVPTFGDSFAAASMVISSTFDSDADGWNIQSIDGDTGEFKSTFVLDYSPTGGNPGGYVSKADPDVNTWFYNAPAKYLGDKSAFYNGRLEYDWIELLTVGELFPLHVVALVGSEMLIVYDLDPPGTDWTHVSVPMSEAGWMHFPSGAAVSQSQFQAVISALDVLVIQGDTRYFHDDGAGLDNVMLIEVPEPAAGAHAGIASIALMAAAALANRRRASRFSRRDQRVRPWI